MSGDYFYLYKLRMGRRPSVNAEIRLNTLIKACKTAYDSDNSFVEIEGNRPKESDSYDSRNGIYIADLTQNDDIFSLLLVRGNPELRVPGMLNVKTKKIRSFTSENNYDVPAVSCHVIISTKEIAKGSSQGKYKMAMEVSRGLGRTLLKDFLSVLMQSYADDNPHEFVTRKVKKHKNDPEQDISFLPTIAFDPQDNGRLTEDLNSGRIEGFKLTGGYAEFTGDAEEPRYKNLDISLSADITPTKDYGTAMSLIANVSEKLGIKFANYKLELLDLEGQTMQSPRAAKLSSHEDDGDMAYCKKIKISGLTANLEEAYDKFYLPILDFGISCINNSKNWK